MISQDCKRHQAAFTIPREHPALPGHFPGNPIVPGVVLLDRVIEAAQDWLGSTMGISALPQVKFVSPLLPAENATISLSQSGDHLDFVVERSGVLLAKGRFVIDLTGPQ